MWVRADAPDFRETADPSVIFYDRKWYLYPSAGMAYVSEDFVTWEHRPLNLPDIGYAPTVVHWRGKFYFTACHAPLYVADHPLGPLTEVAAFCDCEGKPIQDWSDPMLFADDDSLYAYWGLAGDGIKGVRLDPDRPNRAVTSRQVLMKFDPEHHWERFGEWNEDPSQSYVEGPWMVKLRGRYFLTYTAPGTEFSSYGMGAYVGDHPLGPFTYQARNPICSARSGLVRGPGHGCIVKGPNQTIWAFYTCIVRSSHLFERRIGVDPAGFDEQGNLFVRAASEIPQLAPGRIAHPERGNDAGWLPVNHAKPARASSNAPGRTPDYANDGNHRTWWEPCRDDAAPELLIDCRASFDVCAMRLILTEPDLRYTQSRAPEALRYRVDVSAECTGDQWSTVLDRSASTEDWLIDYRTFASAKARRVRLTLLNRPAGGVGVVDFTLFGTGVA